MPAILEIRMQSHLCDCWLCGEPTEMQWGVPTYNGDLVSNDFPDAMWAGSGGGQSVCEDCYRKHERGELETFDHYYTWQLGLFADGAGI